MTEKRYVNTYGEMGAFRLHDTIDDKYIVIMCTNPYHNNEVSVINELNALHEENEELKKENQRLKSDLTHTKILLNSMQDKYGGLLKLVHGFNGDDE